MNNIINSDALTALKNLPDNSVDCCVTSPPYFNLRDYGIDGQIGLENTPSEFVAKLVEVFTEVRRILKPEGTCWINLGDSYASHGKNRSVAQSVASSTLIGSKLNQCQNLKQRSTISEGLKPKDLIGIPWRVAFALQESGWYLRQDVIWQKPNPVPESVMDRCTKAHEYIFLLSKSSKYYFDHKAIQEPAIWSGRRKDQKKGEFKGKGAKLEGDRLRGRESFRAIRDVRNKRSVWTVSTKSYSGAHFAVFPPELIEPCILAGCPEGGVVIDPFFGSGTTGAVAKKYGRNYIGVELNPKYVELARARIQEQEVK